MRTSEPDAGFVPEEGEATATKGRSKGPRGCRVLNVRGVRKLTLVLRDAIITEEIISITPEWWTMTPLSIITIAGVALVILGFTGLYHAHKYHDCCSRQREPYQDSEGGGRTWKFTVQHIFPAILFLGTMATDLYYVLTVPAAGLIPLYIQLFSLFLPHVVFFKQALVHALDKTRALSKFLSHLIGRYIAYATGQIDLFLDRADEGDAAASEAGVYPIIAEADPVVEKYKHNSISLLLCDIP